MKKKINKFAIKRLISGIELDQKYIGKKLVAVPTTKLDKDCLVYLVDKPVSRMLIKHGTKPLDHRSFYDKFNRGNIYTLVYFEWKEIEHKPVEEVITANINAGFLSMPKQKQQSFLEGIRAQLKV
jgi:hypothetical protein